MRFPAISNFSMKENYISQEFFVNVFRLQWVQLVTVIVNLYFISLSWIRWHASFEYRSVYISNCESVTHVSTLHGLLACLFIFLNTIQETCMVTPHTKVTTSHVVTSCTYLPDVLLVPFLQFKPILDLLRPWKYTWRWMTSVSRWETSTGCLFFWDSMFVTIT